MLALLVTLVLLAGLGLDMLAGPPRVPSSLPRVEEALAILAGSTLPVESLLLVLIDVTWGLWLWIVASVGLELVVVCGEVIGQGGAWVGAGRRLADRLTLPFVRRAVAAAFAMQVLSRGVPLAAAQPLPQADIVRLVTPADTRPAQAHQIAATLERASAADASTYLVQAGDTLWSIADQVYGSGAEYRVLVEANLGRPMVDGQVFTAQGVIRPGWQLLLPGLPSRVGSASDGQRWYTVQPGDSLSGIAAEVLGDRSRWIELFDLNVGAPAPDGTHHLSEPDMIWPGMRLRLPAVDDASLDTPAEAEVPREADAHVSSAQAPAVSIAQDVPSDLVAASVPAAAEVVDPPRVDPPLVRRSHAPDPIVLAELANIEPAQDSVGPPGADTTLTSTPPPVELPLGPMAVGGAGIAAAVGVVLGARRLRRLRRPPQRPESDVVVQKGFVEAELAHGLTHSLHGGGTDPAAAIVAQLRRFLDEYNLDDVSVVTVSHGRSSTELTLAAGLAHQPLLVDLAPEFAARLDAHATAWISADQDVVLRLERPRKTRRLPLADGRPHEDVRLTPLGVAYDFRAVSAAWMSLGHVLIASLPGHGADTILTSLVAALTARSSPEQLRVWLIAQPRSLPAPLFELPHLQRVFDPTDEQALQDAAEALRAELDRRVLEATRAELIVVVSELASLGEHAASFELLASQTDGFGVRLICATSSPDQAVLNPLLARFGTRMMLRMQDEETSVALSGVRDAADLGGGGRMLVRLDGREPIALYGYQVSPEHLERLVRIMRSAYASALDAPTSPPAAQPGPQPPPDVSPDPAPAQEVAESEPNPEPTTTLDSAPEPAAATDREAAAESETPTATRPSIQVTCFGGPRVVCAGQQVWPRPKAGDAKPWELLLLLACHDEHGIATSDVVAALWPDDEETANPSHRFRQLRYRLRHALSAVPGGPDTDGICLERGTLKLDPAVVYSDATEFLGRVHSARMTPGRGAIGVLERARDLYVADLLEGPDARRYAWLEERDDSGVTLREHFRRMFHQVSLRLAELYAESGQVQAAIDVYRELADLDPGEEKVWRALFRLHAERGDRTALVREERRMREALRELAEDVDDADGTSLLSEPSHELIHEYQRLLADLRGPETERAAV